MRLLVMDIRWPAETFLERKLTRLVRAGYRVMVLTRGAQERGWEGIEVLETGGWRGVLNAAQWAAQALVRNPMRVLRASVRVAARAGSMREAWRLLVRLWAVEGLAPDVTHFEWTLAAAACLPVIEESGWKFTVSCRGAHVSIAPLNPRRKEQTAQLARVFAKCRAAHCVSDAIAKEAEALGLPESKAQVIRPAVDPVEFAGCADPEAGRRVEVILTGSAIWRKGLEYALAAFRKAVDHGLDARMRVVGGADKENRSRLLYTIADLGLEGRVEWVEAQPPERVAELLGESSVFLHASLSEGISNAVLEAMACGLPVVVTDAGGTREAVRDGVEGFVVPCRDVEAMAEALVRLGRDPELRRRMGEAGRRRVLEEFTLDRQTREWMEFYERVRAGGQDLAAPTIK